MTAPDRRDDSSVFFFPQSLRSNGTAMSNMSFEENSWGDFTKSRDISPQKPTRRKTRGRSSMIETSSSHVGFGSSTTDGFDLPSSAFLGSDVFGSDVLATDPWGDSSEFHKSANNYNDSTSRTANMSDSSEGEEIFETSFACEFPSTDQGMIPLRDDNQRKGEKSRTRSVPRGRQGSNSQQQNQRGRSSRRSTSVGRMVPKVLTDEDVAAKRRNRSRSKSSGRSYRSKPSFVAGATRRDRSLAGSRRGRSLSVPRNASEFVGQRNETKQHLSRTNHTQKSYQKPTSPSFTKERSRSRGPTERKSRNGDKENTVSNNKGGDQATPVNDLGDEDRHLKTRLEDKPKKAQADKTPKASGAKSSKANREKAKKGPNDRSLKVSRARSKSPRRARSKSPKDRSLKGSKDRSQKASRARSKSPMASRARSKSPMASRARSKSPKRARSRTPKDRSLKGSKDRSQKAPRARSKSPKTLRARSKSPKRVKSPKSPRDKSPRTPREISRKTSSTSKPSVKKSPSKSDKDSSKKKATKLFASPLPQKSYLSRGIQKRCVARVSADIDKRRFNIKASLSNLLSDDQESNHFKKCTGGQSIMSAPDKQRDRIFGSNLSKSRRYRRHSMLGATHSDDSDNSQKSQNSISRPRSTESLMESRSRKNQHKEAKQMRRISLHGN